MAERRRKGGLFARLAAPIGAIGRRFTRRSAAAGETAPAGEVEGGVDPALVAEDFTLTLDAMLREDVGRFQTKLQIISLVEFREAVGDKWTRLSEKVMLIAEGAIARHLGPGNVSGRQGQDFFVLLFRTVPEAEGRRRAVRIAEDLGTRLLGDQFAGHALPLALAAEIGLAEAMGPDGRLDPLALAQAIAETRALIADQAETGQPLRRALLPGGLGGDEGGLRRSLLPGEARAAEDAGRTLYAVGPLGEPLPPEQVADPTWRAVEIERPRRTRADPEWTPMAPKRPAVEAAPAAGPPPMPAEAEVSVVWRPTWLAAGEVIGAYLARVRRTDQPGSPPLEGPHAYPVEAAETARRLDRVLIAAAARLLATPAAVPAPALIVPLHWGSVSSAQRLSLLGPLADLPDALRQPRLILDLFGVPDGVSNRDLAQAIAALRPLARQVVLRQPLDRPRPARAAECGARGIGIDLGDLPADRHPDDDALIDSLARLHQGADAAGLAAYAWGLRRRAAVLGTVLGGFAMVNGPGLMKDLDQPARVLPAPRSRFTPAPPA